MGGNFPPNPLFFTIFDNYKQIFIKITKEHTHIFYEHTAEQVSLPS